jgi:hypothetical protein
MSEPAECAAESRFVEILAPKKFAFNRTVICDCCRRRKSQDEFDEDGLGICAECLGSDVLIDVSMRFADS